MFNPRHCRHERTLAALQQVYDNWENDDLSGRERAMRARLIELCGLIARAEIERCHAGLRMIRNHWNEFGPDHGFAETLERACSPIDINNGAGSIWSGLPRKESPTIG